MKVQTRGGLHAPTTRRAFALGAAALLAIGSLAAQAWDSGQGRGVGIDEPVQQWSYGPGFSRQTTGSSDRFGDVGSPTLQRQSQFQGPGRHRVSGFSKAPSTTAGRYLQGPGSGGRGR
jgi:hypothetical protein